jgi:hypothetical protein
MILTVLVVLAYLVGAALLLTTVVLSIRALFLAIRALKKYLQP